MDIKVVRESKMPTRLQSLFRQIWSKCEFYVFQPFLVCLSFLVSRRDDLWIFGSHFGYSDNAKYLYLYAVENEPDIDPLWISTDECEVERLEEDGLPVEYAYSLTGIYLLLRSSRVFVTRALSDIGHWGAVFRAVTVFLDHGVPMMEATYADEKWLQVKQQSTIKNFDYFVVTGEKKPLQAYRNSSYHAVKKATSLPVGYPRTDVFFHKIQGIESDIEHSTANLITQLRKRSTIVFYLPTKRPYQDDNPLLDDPEALERFDRFLATCGAHLLIKLHPNASRALCSSYENMTVISRGLDIYPLLSEADLLITDFSSVFLDYLLLDRPMVFFPYDFEQFTQSRPMLFNYSEITPGPIVSDIDSLKTEIKHDIADPDRYSSRRETVRKSYYKHDSGRASQRIINAVR